MRNLRDKAFLRLRLLIASSAFVCSCAAQPLPPPIPAIVIEVETSTATRSSAEAEALFNFNVPLDRATALVGPDGTEYVGWPAEDAEALLHVFEHRIPSMRRYIAKQETLIGLLEKRTDLFQKAIVETASIAQGYEDLATMWREAALEDQSILHQVFLSKELWLILGVASGIALAHFL